MNVAIFDIFFSYCHYAYKRYFLSQKVTWLFNVSVNGCTTQLCSHHEISKYSYQSQTLKNSNQSLNHFVLTRKVKWKSKKAKWTDSLKWIKRPWLDLLVLFFWKKTLSFENAALLQNVSMFVVLLFVISYSPLVFAQNWYSSQNKL